MKGIVEMVQVLMGMGTDTYAKCKYVLLAASVGEPKMKFFFEKLFGKIDRRKPLLIGMGDASGACRKCTGAPAGAFEIPTDEIKIYPCFAAHEPKPEKMRQKEQYFTETGLLQSQVILDRNGYLIDGFTSYLLAKTHGIQRIPARHGKRQVVRAYHNPGGKLYSWELPVRLIGQVSAGDMAVVRTEKGARTVIVTAVEEYAGNEPEPLKMVIRVKRKGM